MAESNAVSNVKDVGQYIERIDEDDTAQTAVILRRIVGFSIKYCNVLWKNEYNKTVQVQQFVTRDSNIETKGHF